MSKTKTFLSAFFVLAFLCQAEKPLSVTTPLGTATNGPSCNIGFIGPGAFSPHLAYAFYNCGSTLYRWNIKTGVTTVVLDPTAQPYALGGAYQIADSGVALFNTNWTTGPRRVPY